MADRLDFRIHGMDCADEVAILRRELQPLVGAPERLSFDILRGKMMVAAGTPEVGANEIAQAVARTGMRAELWRDIAPDVAESSFWQRRRRTILTAASGIFGLSGFAVQALQVGLSAAFSEPGDGGAAAPISRVSLVCYLAAIVSGGWYVVPRAWNAIKRLRPDMNLLMLIAVVGAAAIGQWLEAAVVAFLFAVSLALESWSVNRARRAVEALLAIAPPTARVLQPDGTDIEVAAAEVAIGAMVIVRPGDRVPLDGSVRRGESDVNQAPITGESVPVTKAPGADVFAGTVNGDGVLEIEVTRLAGETTLAKIIQMVGEAQSRRAPAEQWVDRFALIYTPTIFVAALLVAVVPPLLFDASSSAWLYRALVLLVIGCPCALVISTPVSIVASLAAAARHGVLVKGGAFIEAPAKLKAVALDKTGTLTLGAPEVVDIVPLSGHTEDELLQALGAMEAHSDHPIGRAIAAHVRDRNIWVAPATEVQAVQGRGITAEIDGKRYWLGSHRYLDELRQETPEIHAQIEAMSSAGRTVVIMGNDEHVCGFITLADAVRSESVEAIKSLRALGVAHVIMLTGDNEATARRIADETGVDEVRSSLLPADKVAAVEALVKQFGSVAMIGDGVNDAPAMGRATIGIAMGAAGSDAAIEAADIALMSDDLSKLPWLIEHSRRTLAVIRQNVILSLAVKGLFVVLTFAGYATLWGAIASDMGVSLVVIANALRLLKSR
jgi:Cd2+/Zn2+-exporting ATPase